MQFFSTRDQNRKVTSSEAIAQGLSNEGGLFVPESFPQVDVKALCELDYPAMAAAVIKEYLTDYSQDFLTEAARKTYGDAFGGKAGYLAPVEGDTYALELWHGPTCAFKDYALQLMPKLLVEAKKNLGRTEKTLILVATSGDTGKAALDGYHDIPGVEIAVFYPTGGTSEIQRLQMATQEGANVAVYAVRGNFDDAQTGVKKVFGDKAIAAELEQRGIRLSSANSINWGRLVPQIVYYFYSYAQLAERGDIAPGAPVSFCVPTGNFGNILAAYFAKRMGLPISVVSDKEEVSNFPYLRYLYPLGMVVPSMQDEIFQIEKNIIMDLADKGPCILVGRCADSILAERKNHFSIYIYASYENRLKNCCEYFEMEKAAAEKMIVDADHSRTLYHKRYSKGYHSALDYKDVALNSGSFGVKGSAEILETMIRNWLNC